MALGRSNIFASGALKDKKGRSGLTFESNLALGELGRLINVAARPDGRVTMKGTASFNTNDDYGVEGRIQAEHLSFQQGGHRISGVNVVGAAVIDPHTI